jgi:hypothetical protein
VINVTWENLKEFVGAHDDSDTYVTSCFDTADALVEDFIGTNAVPTSIKDRCVLIVGSELFHQKNAPQGIAQFAAFDGGGPIRVARDPMVGAYPLLARYMVIGI